MVSLQRENRFVFSMEKEIEFLKAWQLQINQHIDIVSSLLDKCSSISKDYIKSKEDDQKEMFNVYHIISF